MNSLYSHLFRSFLILSILSIGIIAPGNVQAFGSLTENGTAAFMGIGINPTKILHVSGTGPGTVPLFQRGSDSAGFIIERTPTNRWVLGVNESPALGNGFVLSTIPTGNTSVPRLMITQGGKVGIGTTSCNSTLQVAGPVATAYKYVNNQNPPELYYTASENDSIIACSPLGEDIVVYLPLAYTCTGRVITVKHVGGFNWVNILKQGSDSVDNASFYVLDAAWEYVTVVSNGSDRWLIVANGP